MGSRRLLFAEEPPSHKASRFWIVRLLITGLLAGGFSAWRLLDGASLVSFFG